MFTIEHFLPARACEYPGISGPRKGETMHEKHQNPDSATAADDLCLDEMRAKIKAHLDAARPIDRQIQELIERYLTLADGELRANEA